jgi:hypothetical protein
LLGNAISDVLVDTWGWTDRVGSYGALSPNSVSVDVDACTGEVVGFMAPTLRIQLPPPPKLSCGEAQQRALNVLGAHAWEVVETNLSLEVDPQSERQFLVWSVRLRNRSTLDLEAGALTKYVELDPTTGEVLRRKAPAQEPRGVSETTGPRR